MSQDNMSESQVSTPRENQGKFREFQSQFPVGNLQMHVEGRQTDCNKKQCVVIQGSLYNTATLQVLY